jgi:pantoate--beta-alanine ligase
LIVNLRHGDYLAGMELITGVRRMQLLAGEVKRSGRRIALVPTMGALHEGHVALVRRAREQGAAVVLSLYVNPTQFGPKEDFKHYPRRQETDLQLCERERVDAVFAPADDELYPGGLWMNEDGSTVQVAVPSPIRGHQYSTFVEELVLARRLEGERRRGFFRGVCTVVSKLFHIVQPDVAVFGLKDYQQFKVIQRMVRDLCWPIEMVGVPTVREADGLACSSRNQYLSPAERAQATVLHKALHVAQDLFNDGETNAHRLEGAMMRTLELAPAARTDYAEIADAETLEPVTEIRRGQVALVAAYVGRTRLIDNLIL